MPAPQEALRGRPAAVLAVVVLEGPAHGHLGAPVAGRAVTGAARSDSATTARLRVLRGTDDGTGT
ncbi:hypothetical protein [Streptomyces sp. NPDC088358]|uniref:hypothetical protein n=1 Tax=Streptomyces sp. NPDC088358 TaxID=3365857 RepID=UPI003801DE10